MAPMASNVVTLTKLGAATDEAAGIKTALTEHTTASVALTTRMADGSVKFNLALCTAAEFDGDGNRVRREIAALRDSIGEHADVGHACDNHAADRRSGARKSNVERQREARDG